MKRTRVILEIGLVTAALLSFGLTGAGPAQATPTTYPDQTLTSSGSTDSGHFDDVYDLTKGDITLAFTYDANGLVDSTSSTAAHAWAELGMRTNAPGAPDFNPNWSGTVYGPWTYEATVPLLAGQTTPMGEVTVTSDTANLYVTYHLDAGWCMTQSHFAAATSAAALPQTKTGNAIPGQFPYGASYNPCSTGDVALAPIPLAGISGWSAGAPLFFAAHAAVWGNPTAMTVVSGTTTKANGSPAVRSTEPGVGVSYPACPAGDNDSVQSLWDSGAKLLGGATPNWGAADWIWSTRYPLSPVAGEVVNFSAPFTVPGLPIGGSLTITADNAYSAALNGASVGNSVSAGPKFPTVLRENVGSGNQVGDWGVASQGWQLVNQWPLTGLVKGANTLAVTAANEYMAPDDSYLSWNTGAQAYVPGSNNTDPDGAISCMNPAGLIFKTDVSYYARSDTAWGSGEGFPGKDWSMYFSSTPTRTEASVNGSGVWLATDFPYGADALDPSLGAQALNDKLILQRVGGHAEGDYNLPSTPPTSGDNYRIWWDRDSVDPYQSTDTANTGGIYNVVITLHATGATTGTAFMTVNGKDQGFETDGVWSGYEGTPYGMTFTGDMANLQVFYGLYGYGAAQTVTFSDITVTQ